jgi:hypothetical protein
MIHTPHAGSEHPRRRAKIPCRNGPNAKAPRGRSKSPRLRHHRPVLSLFTVPKPFRGHIGTIQRNAIRSWTQLRPECEILLCGDDEGTAEVAAEFGVRHIPKMARTRVGSPLLDSVFAAAQTEGRRPTLAFVNADIILLSDFLPVMQPLVKEAAFLILGQRWDLDVEDSIDFDRPDWEAELPERLAKHGSLHSHTGVDYYVFPKHLWPRIPPFAVGRLHYDNRLIHEKLGWKPTRPLAEGLRATYWWIEAQVSSCRLNHAPERRTQAGEIGAARPDSQSTAN